MNVLITGSSGYIGGRLALHLMENKNLTIFLGSRTKNNKIKLLKNLNYVQINWEKEKKLIEACSDKHSIVHTAGLNAKDSEYSFVDAYKVNVLNTANLLNIAIQQKVKRFIYISTAHVYGSKLNGKINEDSVANSIQSYAASHKAAEDMVINAHLAGKIQGIVIRLSNSFGAPISADANCWSLLVNDLCCQGVTNKKLIINSSGIQKRDFISMNNTVKAIEHLLGIPNNSIGNGIFNVGSGFSSTIIEMAEYVAEIFHSHFNYKTDIIKKSIQDANPVKEKLFISDISKLRGTGFINDENARSEIINLIQFVKKNFS